MSAENPISAQNVEGRLRCFAEDHLKLPGPDHPGAAPARSLHSEWGTTFGQEVAGYSDTWDNPDVFDVISVDPDYERADQALAAAIAHGVPHARLSEIPTTLAPWLLPVEWSRERLWTIERQPVELPVAALRWLYDLPLWRAQDGRWFMVTPREFLRGPAGYAEHEKRVARADLSRPVHALWRHDRWFLIDGVHRLVKADRAGWSTIPAVVVGPEDLPSFIEQVRS